MLLYLDSDDTLYMLYYDESMILYRDIWYVNSWRTLRSWHTLLEHPRIWLEKLGYTIIYDDGAP